MRFLFGFLSAVCALWLLLNTNMAETYWTFVKNSPLLMPMGIESPIRLSLANINLPAKAGLHTSQCPCCLHTPYPDGSCDHAVFLSSHTSSSCCSPNCQELPKGSDCAALFYLPHKRP